MKKNFDKKLPVVFGAGFLLILLTLSFYNISEFYHDSLGYWDLSTFFLENGFHVRGFPEGRIKELSAIRGYFFPLLLAVFRMGRGGVKLLYWIGISAAYSAAFVCLIPALIQRLTGKLQTALQRLIVLALALLFFPDLFCYPLTDLPAVLLYFAALLFLFKIRDQKEGNIYTPVYAFLFGMLSYIVYNIRPNYIFNLYLSVILLIFINRNLSIKYRILMAAAAVLGIILPALPQCLINYGNFGVYSYENPLSLGSPSRISFLLFEGMQYPRIDTIVVPGIDTSNIFCLDPVFANIIQNEGLVYSPETFGILTWLRLFFRYPLEFIGLLASHIVNFLDLRYNASYIKSLKYNFVKAVGNIFVIYYFWMVLRSRFQKSALQERKLVEWHNFLELLKKYGMFAVLTVLPAVLAIPGHVEIRYTFAVYCVIYITIGVSLKDIRGTVKYIRDNIVTAVMGFLILFGAYAAVVNWTLANSNLGNMIFGG